LLSAENARTKTVWHWFMENREIPHAMDLIGLRRSRKDLSEPVTRKRVPAPGVQKTEFTRNGFYLRWEFDRQHQFFSNCRFPSAAPPGVINDISYISL